MESKTTRIGILLSHSVVWLLLIALELSSSAFAQFTATGNMTTARFYHTATLLPSGKVLIAGGVNSSGRLSSAELYDPATGTFSTTGSMTVARAGHAATLLPNGKVLIVGGSSGGDNTELSSAELYDPATGTFTPTGTMANARNNPTATVLDNGDVLVAGGNVGSYCTTALGSAELYDPAMGTFTPTGSMTSARFQHTATLLNNGQVLVAGGLWPYLCGPPYASSELYDSATGTFATTGTMNNARNLFTATLLSSGKVLVAGGSTGGSNTTSSAELYDPSPGTFTGTGSLATPRSEHTATLLSSGQVLVAGGENSAVYGLASAELYDPATGAFNAAGSMITGRTLQTATLLNNGEVLIAGGNTNVGALASAELFFEYGVCALYDQTKSVHSGAVFPIKLELCDGSGDDLSSPNIVLHATAVTMLSTVVGVPESPGNSNADSDFRFDSTMGTTGGYIFNLKTTGLASGTYSLQFIATGDPVTHSVTFGVN